MKKTASQQAIRLKLIRSCLCSHDSTQKPSNINTLVDLMGSCGFYILTEDESILQYYPLQKSLADWLFNEMAVAVGTEKKYPDLFHGDDKVKVGPLYAMQTTADGNCLLHAISICLWGVEDMSENATETSIIRTALKEFMLDHRDVLLCHYKAAEKRFDKAMLGGIETSDEYYTRQLDQEIDRLDDNKKYLSSLHVFVLANMLHRPIIIYAQPNANGIMRGIYLPTMCALISPTCNFPSKFPFLITLVFQV